MVGEGGGGAFCAPEANALRAYMQSKASLK